jgi:opine dehydrogenase
MSIKPTIAVLGGGNGAFCHAADLTLKGFSVNLCEVPEMAENLSGVKERGGIELKLFGNPGIEPGFAKLQKVTFDAEEALIDADIVMVIVPAFAQCRFAEFSAPYLRSEQLVLLSPGNFGGCFEFWKVMRELGSRESPLLCETECMTYSGFKSGSAEIEVAGYKHGHAMAAFPGHRTSEAMERLKPIFPTMKAARNVLETGLRNVNTVMHPPMMVLNAGRIEYTQGDFLLYWHGVTKGVGFVVERVEDERLALGKALELNLPPTRDVLLEWYGHSGAKGDRLSEVMRTNPVYELDSAPPSLEHRFLTEDIPYGMIPMENMAELAGVSTPITTALIELGSALLNRDLRNEARDLEYLGLQDLTLDELKRFFDKGPETR